MYHKKTKTKKCFQCKLELTAVEVLCLIDWLSMVLRLHQHNIGYTADRCCAWNKENKGVNRQFHSWGQAEINLLSVKVLCVCTGQNICQLPIWSDKDDPPKRDECHDTSMLDWTLTGEPGSRRETPLVGWVEHNKVVTALEWYDLAT